METKFGGCFLYVISRIIIIICFLLVLGFVLLFLVCGFLFYFYFLCLFVCLLLVVCFLGGFGGFFLMNFIIPEVIWQCQGWGPDSSPYI